MEPSSPQILQLRAVVRDVAALFDLEAPQSHLGAAGAIGQRIGLAPGSAGVSRRRSAQFLDAACPERRMLQLGLGQMAQHLRAHRIGVAIGERRIGVVALHLGLPVAFESGQHLPGPGAVQRAIGTCISFFFI